jgi:RNA polymerase sigma-70 factor (ECF subfamily)
MNAKEFQTMFLPMKHRLYRLALRILGDPDDASDAVQDTLVRLWNGREKLDGYASKDAFALVVTRNICLDRVRSKGYRHEDLDAAEVDGGPRPDEITENTESVGLVRKVIGSLPELQRTIIHLRDVEGLEFDEIAVVTELNVNAIRVNLSRARKKVRDTLIKLHNYELARN